MPAAAISLNAEAVDIGLHISPTNAILRRAPASTRSSGEPPTMWKAPQVSMQATGFRSEA